MLTQQTPPPKLFIQMSGAPGAGKSTVAQLLGRSIGGVVIDHDVLRSSLLDSHLPFEEAAKHAYQLQWTLADTLMRQGFSVVMDSTCNFPQVLERGVSCAREHGHAYWYVECKVQDIDLLDRRLRARGSLTSQRTGVDGPPAAAVRTAQAEDSRALFQRWIEHPCRPQDTCNAVVVDSSTEGPETLRDAILKRIMMSTPSGDSQSEVQDSGA